MSKLTPLKRSIFIKKLIKLGFDWPYIWWKHEYLKKWNYKITIPNIHSWKDLWKPIISKICKEIWISITDFMNL